LVVTLGESVLDFQGQAEHGRPRNRGNTSSS